MPAVAPGGGPFVAWIKEWCPMAGDWIKMRSNLWDHPKVVRIVSAICPQSVRDLSARCRVIGALYRTWALADAHTSDGILDGYDADALDSAVGIEGWSANLQHVGWLVVEPQRLILPRFTEHGGQTAKRRAEDAARKGRVRKASAKCPQPSGQNAEQRREEKRRVKKENKELSLPISLRTNAFEIAWAEWTQHRIELGKPIKPTGARAQLAEFESWGPERAIAAIRHTIAKGWQGIREAEPERNGVPPKPPPIPPANAPPPPRRLPPVNFKHDPYATTTAKAAPAANGSQATGAEDRTGNSNPEGLGVASR